MNEIYAQLADALARRIVGYARDGRDNPCSDGAWSLRATFAKVVADARRKALEDACKAACGDCDTGTEVFWDACMQEWAHDLGPSGTDPEPYIVTCEANEIRIRSLMEDESK